MSEARRRGGRLLEWGLWAVAAAALAGLAVARYAPAHTRDAGPPTPPVAAAPSPPPGPEASASAGPKVLRTRPIESIRVGDRVLGENPDREQVAPDEPEPDPRTWVRIDVRMTKPSGRVLEATLLRPRAWLEHELDHATCRVYLDLEELGAVGWADVTSVGRCPPVQTGPGHVVTATFHHQPDKPLVAVRIEGAAEPIECTANHPFWSEDRQEFIEAGELRPRERVLARRGGPVRVAAVEPRDTAPWVHNLEVHGEHVYEVGTSGVTVHNKYLSDYFPGKTVVLYRVASAEEVASAKALGRFRYLPGLDTPMKNKAKGKWFWGSEEHARAWLAFLAREGGAREAGNVIIRIEFSTATKVAKTFRRGDSIGRSFFLEAKDMAINGTVRVRVLR
ncbi:Hint domain-containing protein [Gemmata sp. JC673]|uniref:Hint domain-containing protein n=1 Tax=Gemmata algarum TaxID=2975278 RepID=A0ABU5F6S8_9BACT|nr:Hint domain-containing protein [Gemmata algarum]MDY3563015.1 Hint domain-containing protein [Gemmata algarum]